jgi:histidinol-phosphate aminotransferase
MKKWLNRNEASVKPAPAVENAIRRFDLSRAAHYFEGYYGSSLAPAIARKFNLDPSRVSVGYGAEFFLRAIFDSCDSRRDVILTNALHYSFYSAYAKVRGIRLVEFKLIDRGDRFEFDVADCVRKIKSIRPKVVIITSPNNPTGNSISPVDFEKIVRAANRSKTLVVLDQAYWGFDPKYDERAFLSLLRRYGNVVILRSFSKYYGLAGLRIGSALWGARAKSIVRFKELYLGGSRLLEEIGAAALASDPYYRKTARELIDYRLKFIAAVNRLGVFRACTSDANFVLIKIIDKNYLAKIKSRLNKECAGASAVISKFVAPDLIRVSLGSSKDIAAFLALLKNIDKEYSSE